MKVFAMIRTLVPVEIEVDDKFQPLAQEVYANEYKLRGELLEQAEKVLSEAGIANAVFSVESVDGIQMAEW